jgi:hypothetical protein
VQGVRAPDGRLPRLLRRQERVHPHRAQLMSVHRPPSRCLPCCMARQLDWPRRTRELTYCR